MRFAWHKYGVIMAFLCAAVASAQTNPHTQIRWPANCDDSNYMSYNVLLNSCITVGPVGADKQVQFNSGGAWGVDAGFTYDKGTHTLSAPNLNVPGGAAIAIPPSGIQWPSDCLANGKVYDVLSQTCKYNITTIDPGTQLTWPASCSTGVYSPATNTCVSTGSANNPGGSPGQIQVNAGGNFGGLNSQGNGLLVQRSTGTTQADDCASFDANGNTVSAGRPCGGTAFSLKNGIGVWSDSIGGGTGLPVGLGWGLQLATVGGTAVTCNGVIGGTAIADTTYNMIGACGSLPADHNNRVNFMEIGTNAANGNNAPSASYQLGEEQSAVAAGLILGTSGTNKYWFSNSTLFTPTGSSWATLIPINSVIGAAGSGYAVSDVLTLTQAGSCGCATIMVDTLGASNSVASYHFVTYGSGYVNGFSTTSGGTGTGATINFGWYATWAAATQSSVSGESILSTSLIVGNKGTVGLVYGAYQSGGAGFQIFMDGGSTPLTDVVSNSTTLSSNYTGHARFGGADVRGLTWIGAVFSGIAPGSHTFTVQSTSSGLFTPMFLAIPHSNSYGGGDGPNLIMSNAMPEQGNAFNVSSCLLSNSHAAAASVLRTMGIIGVQYVDIAGWSDKACGSTVFPTNMDTVRDFASTATAAASITNCAVASTGVATLNATNTFTAGTQIYIAGLTVCQGINSTPSNGYTVLASGLSGTQFQVQTALKETIASSADAGTAALMSKNVVLNLAPPLHPSSSGQNKIAQGFAKAAGIQSGANGSGPLIVTGPTANLPALGYTDGFGKWGVNCLARQFGTIIGGCISSTSLSYFLDFMKWNGSAWVSSASLDYAGSLTLAQGVTAPAASIGAATIKQTLTLANGADAAQQLIFKPGLTANQTGQIYWEGYTGTILWNMAVASGQFQLLDSVANIRRLLIVPNGVTNFNSGAGANDVQINATANSGTAGLSVWNGGATPAKVGGINGAGIVSGNAVLPVTLYSAAGTALPACGSGIKGEQATVSDATAPTYMGAYTSGGAITAAVICSYNGTTYSWLTH